MERGQVRQCGEASFGDSRHRERDIGCLHHARRPGRADAADPVPVPEVTVTLCWEPADSIAENGLVSATPSDTTRSTDHPHRGGSLGKQRHSALTRANALAMFPGLSLARPVGGNCGMPFCGASLAQPMDEAAAIRNARQAKDLSHRDLLLVARPFDRCRHHNGLRLCILYLDRIAASLGHRHTTGSHEGTTARRSARGPSHAAMPLPPGSMRLALRTRAIT